MRLIGLLFAGAALIAAAPAMAQSAPDTFSVGVTGGTLGIGPEVGFRSGAFGGRANATFLGYGRDVDSDDINYDGKLKLRSYGAMLDLYVFGGGFRVSPGLRVSRNRVTLKATPTANVEIGDETYTPAEIGTLSGEVRAKKLAPTLTVGWGTSSPGFYFGLDAGAMFQGSPKVKKLTTTGLLSTNADLQADLAVEREEIEDDIDNFKIDPILQLALGYRFGRAPAAAEYVAPVVAEPVAPAAPATQTCADGSVILATDMCPPPPAPPAPPSAGERG